MQADATPVLPSCVARYGDIDWRVRLLGEQPPDSRRGSMTENGPLTTGQRGRHPSTLGREAGMPDCVNATVDRVQAANSNTMPHAVLVQAGLAQLLHRDNAVLPGCDRGQANVWIGASVAHIATKAPAPSIRPFG